MISKDDEMHDVRMTYNEKMEKLRERESEEMILCVLLPAVRCDFDIDPKRSKQTNNNSNQMKWNNNILHSITILVERLMDWTQANNEREHKKQAEHEATQAKCVCRKSWRSAKTTGITNRQTEEK